jgi:sulfopyruvate decarboxylase TPP-binding subunit
MNVTGTAAFPCESVAVQVTVVEPMGKMVPEDGTQVARPLPSTVSVVVGGVYTTPAPFLLSAVVVMSSCGLIAGAIVSCTVTLKLPLTMLLCESVAEQVTIVVPMGKVLPEAGTQVTDIEPFTRSDAEAEYETIAPEGLVASVVISDGSVRVGAVVSCTVTLKLPFAVIPLVSDAEQLTVVEPRAKMLPDRGEQVTGTEPSTASFAVGAEYVTVAPDAPVASTVISAGRLITGGVVSATIGAML